VRLFPGPSAAPPDEDTARATLAALPLDEVPAPSSLPVGSRLPLSANPLFVGREEDLKTLARQLKAGETSAVGQVETAAATGLGGIGKTQLASEFAHRFGRYFAGGVFWMSFADGATVPVEVAACGASLGLHLSFDTLTLDQQVRLVEEAWKSPLPRLLIFDNCEEEELLSRWRPHSGGARVLLTSRRSEWAPALAVKTVPLTTLARPASIELLRRFRSDVPASDPALDEIATELGDLPLALHLAGNFLHFYRSSPFGQPAAYLEQLRKAELLDHPSLQGRGAGISPTGHEGHVGRTFALSFERLDQEIAADVLAIDLLARAAWFAPGEPIPRTLLLKTADIDSGDPIKGLDAVDALRRLTDLGLIESNDRNDLLMHRLVAAWAQGVAQGHEALQAVEEAVLEEATRLNEDGNPALLLVWQPHLRVVAERANKRADKIEIAARLYDELGTHLWRAANYSEGRIHLERAVALHDGLSGPEHPDTAKSLNILGRLLHSQGDYPEARSYYERSLAIREKVLGLEHPDTAQSLNDIGVVFDDQGTYREARPYLERALEIREKVLGPDHPDTGRSLGNLANLLQAQGDYGGAHPYRERALAICEKVLGPEHPDTALNLHNLSSLLQAQGDHGGARHHLERALAISEKVLGPEHPDTALSLYSFANILQLQGDFKEARLYVERALAIQEKVLGVDHPVTAKGLLNLGILYFNLGNFSRARLYLERALSIFKARLGPNHPDTRDARRFLSRLPGARRIKEQRPKKKS
jgi:tetratricopeptide (TPR) repeat protein